MKPISEVEQRSCYSVTSRLKAMIKVNDDHLKCNFCNRYQNVCGKFHYPT